MAVSVARQSNMDLRELRRALESTPQGKALFQAVVDRPFDQTVAAAELFLGFISMFIASEKEVKWAASSDNEFYHLSVQGYDFNPSKYRLSLDADKDNDIVKAINTGKPQMSGDWKSYTRRSADPEQARLNQANGGISSNAVYPLDIVGGGALLFCFFNYQDQIGSDQQKFMKRYAQLVSEVIKSKS